MKLKTTTIILILVCIVGLSLLLYPTVSNYWNERHSTKVINSYISSLNTIDEAEYKRILESATQYNTDLLDRENPYTLTPPLEQRYEKNLDLSGNGIMGYIEIPKLDVFLPVYHGTSENVLQVAAGHLDWTSLPVGGPSTHCVLSGHRGLPSAKLFTDLDTLREGDLFTLNILNETLTYEVDQIRTVLPQNVLDLTIVNGCDYCTLVTCTPYGINSHRLLVRGHRVETVAASNIRVISEAVIIDPLIVAPIVAFPFIFALLMMVMLKKPQKKINPKEFIKAAMKADSVKN